MPKRRNDSPDRKIERYLKKIRRLEEKCHRSRESRRSRTPSFNNFEVFDDDYQTDADTTPTERNENASQQELQSAQSEHDQETQPQSGQDENLASIMEIDPSEISLDTETLTALGKPYKEKEKYGQNINGDLSKLWAPILKYGLGEDKKLLLEKYLVPNNCQLLQAPKLNPEIVATVTDSIKNRDKKIEEEQQQLGQGLTALNRALSLLATNTGERVTIINTLSEASQILSDLHYTQTLTRKRLITPILDKKFLDLVKDTDRDEYLYGNDLSEKLKAMKYAQKSSQSIKKTFENFKQFKKPAYNHNQVNFRGPSRYQHQKPYNRSGPKRPSDRNFNYKPRHYSQVKKSKPEVKTPAQK